jgi:hypothetical protein
MGKSTGILTSNDLNTETVAKELIKKINEGEQITTETMMTLAAGKFDSNGVKTQGYNFSLTPQNKAVLEKELFDRYGYTVNLPGMGTSEVPGKEEEEVSEENTDSSEQYSTLENEFYPFEQLTDFLSFLSQSFSDLGIPLTFYGAVALFLTFLKLNKNGYIFPSSLTIQVYTTTFKNFFHFGILKKSLHQRLRDFLLFIISLIRK